MWSITIPNKLIKYFLATQILLPCTQYAACGPISKPDKSAQHFHILFS